MEESENNLRSSPGAGIAECMAGVRGSHSVIHMRCDQDSPSLGTYSIRDSLKEMGGKSQNSELLSKKAAYKY